MESSESKPREARPPQKPRRADRDYSAGAPPAVAALRMEPLTLWVVKRVEAFPRAHRFTVGERWIETCLDIQTALVEASYVRDKRGLLLAASRGLVRGRVLARLAASLHAISLDQEASFGAESGEIGRMVGGWLRSLHARPAPTPQAQPPAQQNVGLGNAP
ncbi:MAG: four helix bundle protein [Polyangiaceae bacterium]